MKKLFSAIAVLAMMLVSGNSYAQNNYAKFNKGDLAFNLNYGIGGFTSYDGVDFDDNILQHSIGLSGEYGIIDGMINGKASIGVGDQLGLGFGRETWGDSKTIATRIRIATRGVFHYQFIPQLDTYAGLTFCFVDIDNYTFKNKENGDWEKTGDGTDTNFIEPRLFAGCRYMISRKFGFNAEFSWDRFAYVGLGVTVKL